MASNAENVSIWWRHHVCPGWRRTLTMTNYTNYRLTVPWASIEVPPSLIAEKMQSYLPLTWWSVSRDKEIHLHFPLFPHAEMTLVAEISSADRHLPPCYTQSTSWLFFSWRHPDSVNHVINVDQLEYPDLSTTTVKDDCYHSHKTFLLLHASSVPFRSLRCSHKTHYDQNGLPLDLPLTWICHPGVGHSTVCMTFFVVFL